MSNIEPCESAEEYDLVKVTANEIDNATSALKDLVMTGMAAGWEPTGGVAVYLDSPNNTSVTLLQAMVRYQS